MCLDLVLHSIVTHDDSSLNHDPIARLTLMGRRTVTSASLDIRETTLASSSWLLLALLSILLARDPTLAAGGPAAAAAEVVAQDLTSPWPTPVPVSSAALTVDVVWCDRH